MNNKLSVIASVTFLQDDYIFVIIDFALIDPDYLEDNCITLYSCNGYSF
jgi:hypothetical protein